MGATHKMESTLSKARSCGTQRQLIYFCFGALLGSAIGSIIALTFAVLSTQTVHYYYYYGDTTIRLQVSQEQIQGPSLQILDSHPGVPSFPLQGAIGSASHKQQEEEPEINLDKLPTWYDYKHLSTAVPNSLPSANLLVVLTGGERCDLLNTVIDTWGRSISLLLIIDSDCILPTNWKQSISSLNNKVYYYNYNSYHFNNKYKIFHYIDEFIPEKHDWYLFVSLDTYVNVKRLETLLKQFKSIDSHLFGTPLVKSSSYCSDGPGFVISQNVLHAVIKTSDVICDLRKLFPTKTGILFEIGHCLVNQFHLNCSEQLSKTGTDFFEDIGQLSATSNFMKFNDFKYFSTIHPIKTSYTLHKLNYFYTVLEYSDIKSSLDNMKTFVDFTYSKLQDTSKPSFPNLLKSGEYPLYNEYPLEYREMKSWLYFDSTSIYEDENISPQKPLLTYSYYKMELDNVLLEAVRLANIDYPSPLIFHKLLNGYIKHDGVKGNIYIVDIQLKEQNNPFVTLQRRFSFRRPLSLNFEILPSKNVVTEVINFIVPVANVNERLSDFLKMYEELTLARGDNTRLILVTYSDTDVKFCKKELTYYTDRYPNAQFTIVKGKGEFARARALHEGTQILDSNDLMFFCDVDMNIDEKFLEKCRLNAVQGQQVYYPEVFKLYNMKYAYKSEVKPIYVSISRRNGHWGYYAYGMLCTYKSDYTAVGGLDISMIGWGGEDVVFFERFLKHKYQVIRAPDPSLTHKWHPKYCNQKDSEKQKMCQYSRSEILADRRELARYIYELEKNNTHLFCI